MVDTDFLIIGAGIAGTSVGYHLAENGRVILLEREASAGYHTTGRSAAQFSECYGGSTIRRLSRASRHFFESPPQGFAGHALLSPRGVLYVARDDQLDSLLRVKEEGNTEGEHVQDLSVADAFELFPVVRPEYVAGALYERAAMDLDVNAVHQGFLRGAKTRGARLVVRAELVSLAYETNRWLAETTAGVFSAPVIVNAAGAWCDEIATLAGARTLGLVPKRRTAFTFDLPADLDPRAWPMLCDIDEMFYCKPTSGRMLASPGDETPMPPCDVQPEDMDVALAIERVQIATSLQVSRIHSRWAGLRSFVSDGGLVIGFDEEVPGFFWLAGQGGYGIQTVPAASRAAAGLLTGVGLPADVLASGVTSEHLSPGRLERSSADEA